MTRRPLDEAADAVSTRPLGKLVSLGRKDTELYRPLRDWMAAADVSSSALPSGAAAPDFFLPDERARLVSLSKLLARGPVVLLFVPGGWCSFCMNKVRALNAALRGQATSLAVITPETGPYPLNMKEQNELECVVLADVDYGVGLSFGLVYAPPPPIVTQMKALGLDLGALHGSSKAMLPAPAVYVIAPSREIVMAHVELDYMTSADPEKVVEAVKAAL
jgi:peroxiredoxin